MLSTTFFAETRDGSFRVANSDKTFSDAAFQDSDTQPALNDLIHKLKAGGWQQVFGPPFSVVSTHI